jgi:hypothetical protein
VYPESVVVPQEVRETGTVDMVNDHLGIEEQRTALGRRVAKRAILAGDQVWGKAGDDDYFIRARSLLRREGSQTS